MAKPDGLKSTRKSQRGAADHHLANVPRRDRQIAEAEDIKATALAQMEKELAREQPVKFHGKKKGKLF